MTELEMHLLNALEQLQQDYTQRLKDWESAFTDLQHMFELTRQENGQLREQCDDLSQQVQRLVEQVDHLRRLFITNSREGMNRKGRHAWNGSVRGPGMKSRNGKHGYGVARQ